MHIKKLSIIALCAFFNTQIFSMDIKNGEQYLNTHTQEVVTIQGSCKETWGIDRLTKAGDKIRLPAIYNHLETCIQESKSDQDQEIRLEAALDPRYHGEFYYAKCNDIGECVHPSWLSPVKEVALNEIEHRQCATWSEVEAGAADVKDIWPWAYDETSE